VAEQRGATVRHAGAGADAGINSDPRGLPGGALETRRADLESIREMRMTRSTAPVGRRFRLVVSVVAMLGLASSVNAGEFLDLVSFSGFDYESDGAGGVDPTPDPLAGGTAADYGVDPPNAARTTFTDGKLVLSAPVTNFVLSFNQSTQAGIWDSSAEADAGSWLAALLPTSCTLNSGGQIGIAGVEVPRGYGHAVSGAYQRVCGLPVRQETWGAVKSLYR
jgi:hypothetical protein